MITKINKKWRSQLCIMHYALCIAAALLLTACADDDNESASVGLGIKAFFPEKVVAGQPMTINGSGFDAVTEIEFPGGVKVTGFELVGNDMLRVNAPSGIAAEGGSITVRTAGGDEAQSQSLLTLGKTRVTGFDKQQGENVTGGDLITVYGSDLEFINSVELLDSEGEPQLIDHKDFYRKGTSQMIFRVPAHNIYKGTFTGKLHTYDGQQIAMPELAYEPAATGHWELKKTLIWKNNDPAGRGAVGWSGTYRFGREGTDGNNECIATIPSDVWDKMKTTPFVLKASIANEGWYSLRITTGWWSTTYSGADISKGDERLVLDENGSFTLVLDLGGDPLRDVIDQQHLLFTGDGYIPMELYFEEEVWVEDGPKGSAEYDIAQFSLYEDRSAGVEWPYHPSWSANSGKIRIMRGLGDPAIETLPLTTSSKFIVYKEVGTKGQLQWNNPNWGSFPGIDCTDWGGDAETLEVPVTEEMLKCFSGETRDGWSETAIILQGDGLTITKIVLIP